MRMREERRAKELWIEMFAVTVSGVLLDLRLIWRRPKPILLGLLVACRHPYAWRRRPDMRQISVLLRL